MLPTEHNARDKMSELTNNLWTLAKFPDLDEGEAILDHFLSLLDHAFQAILDELLTLT